MIDTNKLIIEDGAVFNGASVMGKASLKQKEYDKQGESSRRISKYDAMWSRTDQRKIYKLFINYNYNKLLSIIINYYE